MLQRRRPQRHSGRPQWLRALAPSVRDPLMARGPSRDAQASPALLYAACALALLLAILQVDRHAEALRALGVMQLETSTALVQMLQ